MNLDQHYSHAATIIPVNDIQNTLAYYKSNLGFEVTFEWGDPLEYVVGKLGAEISIHFTKVYQASKLNTSLYVFVHDIDKLYEKLKSKQVEISNLIDNRDYGMRDFDIIDINGFRITFGTSLER